MTSEDIKEQVKEHYSEYGIKEWERLIKHPQNRLEFDTSMHYLRKYIPKNGFLLDAGGGPGRYTIELARLGYDVVLSDLSPKLLEIAKEEIKKANVESKVKQIIEGSVDDLSMFEEDTFDAVLCLGGVLGHLVLKTQREKAVNELIRVAKNNALIFVSVIGRLAVLMDTVVYLWPEFKTDPDIWRKYALTGDYMGEYWFTACHFYLPEELKAEFKDKARILEMVGLEGIFSTHSKEYNEVYEMGKYNELLYEMHLKTCTNPSIVGISEHFMIICKK